MFLMLGNILLFASVGVVLGQEQHKQILKTLLTALSVLLRIHGVKLIMILPMGQTTTMLAHSLLMTPPPL